MSEVPAPEPDPYREIQQAQERLADKIDKSDLVARKAIMESDGIGIKFLALEEAERLGVEISAEVDDRNRDRIEVWRDDLWCAVIEVICTHPAQSARRTVWLAEGAVFDTFPEAFAFAWAQLQSAPSR